MPATIVAGTGPAPGAADALALAGTLAPLLGAQVVAAEVEVRGHDRHAAVIADRDAEGRMVVRARSVVRGLRAVADATGALLIVAGATRRPTLGRRSRHADADQLLATPGCAVAFAPAGYAGHPADDVRVIGVGFDGTPESMEAARAAGALAARLGATLRIHAYTSTVPVTVGATVPDRTDLGMSAKEHLEHGLDELLQTVPEGVRPLGRVLIGDPVGGLVELAGQVDLLVLGTHVRGSLERALLGSVGPSVVAASGTPVLVFGADSAAQFADALALTA